MDIGQTAAYGGRGWSPRTAAARDELGAIWTRCGVSSEFTPLRRVLLHRPGEELRRISDPDAALMLEKPDADAAAAEHDGLAEAYRAAGVDVVYVDPPGTPPPNQMYVADVMFMTPLGAILGRPASTVRAGEERWVARRLADVGVPILRSVSGAGVFEGADAMWLNAETVLVGSGPRTNQDGAAQVAATLAEQGVRTIAVEMPAAAMHLMGMIRIVDRGLAYVRKGMTPPAAVAALRDCGYGVRSFPSERENVRGFANNLVVLGPRRILMSSGNPETEADYRAAGIECITTSTRELGKGAGAIGCLTGVLHREQA